MTNPDTLKEKEESVLQGARILVEFCGQVRLEDRVLIITDSTTKEVGRLLLDAANKASNSVVTMETDDQDVHGTEPPAPVAKAMLEADVIFAAAKSSIAHTQARSNATKRGARFLSLPEYSIEQLASPALTVDFVECARTAKKIKDLFDAGRSIRITTKKGTDLTLDCSDRTGNFCPGFCAKPGSLGSPPDIETNVAPLEDRSSGTLIVDGSIPFRGIGLLDEDICVTIKKGSITGISGGGAKGERLLHVLESRGSPAAKVLAEFGVGMNPKARLCGLMLEDEGCAGTVHFGFGSNSTIGGKNVINFHIDFVIRKPTVSIDERIIIKEGSLCLDD